MNPALQHPPVFKIHPRKAEFCPGSSLPFAVEVGAVEGSGDVRKVSGDEVRMVVEDGRETLVPAEFNRVCRKLELSLQRARRVPHLVSAGMTKVLQHTPDILPATPHVL